jgi:hypothetical protein
VSTNPPRDRSPQSKIVLGLARRHQPSEASYPRHVYQRSMRSRSPCSIAFAQDGRRERRIPGPIRVDGTGYLEIRQVGAADRIESAPVRLTPRNRANRSRGPAQIPEPVLVLRFAAAGASRSPPLDGRSVRGVPTIHFLAGSQAPTRRPRFVANSPVHESFSRLLCGKLQRALHWPLSNANAREVSRAFSATGEAGFTMKCLPRCHLVLVPLFAITISSIGSHCGPGFTRGGEKLRPVGGTSAS